MEFTIEQIAVGDLVIRADGLKGKVIQVALDDQESYAVFSMENKESYLVRQNDLQGYFLIGKTVIGNRGNNDRTENKIADVKGEIADVAEQLAEIQKQIDTLYAQVNACKNDNASDEYIAAFYKAIDGLKAQRTQLEKRRNALREKDKLLRKQSFRQRNNMTPQKPNRED